ncbi:epoxyqueuosine reductase [bacterium]|nr:epoxyqueuosine reductase [bacterium]
MAAQSGINESIIQIFRNEFVDYFGFADLYRYQAELVKSGGKIVSGYPRGISIGIALPDVIVDFMPDREDPNVACEYKTHCYDIMNERLNLIASRVSSFLTQKGYRTLPIPASERTNEAEAIPTVSHKMIAHIAGLGWIGKNCLLITPDHGPRVRFVSLLTDAPVNGTDNPIEQRCHECDACVNICPSKAIKGINYETGSAREDRFEHLKCQAYFESMSEKTKWDVCGMCLTICPYGKKRNE